MKKLNPNYVHPLYNVHKYLARPFFGEIVTVPGQYMTPIGPTLLCLAESTNLAKMAYYVSHSHPHELYHVLVLEHVL